MSLQFPGSTVPAAHGTEFHNLVTATFNKTHEQGEWFAQRVCTFTFTRE